MPKKQDLAQNTVFSRLKVLTKAARTGSGGRSYYHCECVCGNLTIASRSDLVTGKTKSCGCWLRLSPTYLFKQPAGNASHNNLFNRCAKGARSRGIEFTLTREEHATLVVQNCHYCNIPAPRWNVYQSAHSKKQRINLNYETFEAAWINAHGVDRVDSNVGYHTTNVVSCCSACNYAKKEMTYQQYIDHCARVTEYQRSKSA